MDKLDSSRDFVINGARIPAGREIQKTVRQYIQKKDATTTVDKKKKTSTVVEKTPHIENRHDNFQGTLFATKDFPDRPTFTSNFQIRNASKSDRVNNITVDFDFSKDMFPKKNPLYKWLTDKKGALIDADVTISSEADENGNFECTTRLSEVDKKGESSIKFTHSVKLTALDNRTNYSFSFTHENEGHSQKAQQ